MPSSTTSAGSFPTVNALLIHLATNAGQIGYVTTGPHGKQVIPIAIDASVLESAIRDHLAGTLTPRPCCTRDQYDGLVANALALAIYAVRAVGSRFATSLLLFDVDGPGHADGLSEADVHRVTSALSALLERSGLAPIIVRSGGGHGRHILVIFADPIDAGMARWIGETVRELVPGAHAVEIFPKQTALRPGQIGSAVTLPAMGRPTGTGGGVRVDADGVDLAWSDMRCADAGVVATLMSRWSVYERSLAEASTIARQVARFRTLASDAPPMADDYIDVGLEAVARAVATIADDRVTEAHIIGVLCPTHGGSCFHIAPEQGWYCCHKCSHKGAGPAAALMLLRLFQPKESDASRRAFLERLRSTRTEAGSAGGAP